MEFDRSDTRTLIDGKIRVKLWPIFKKIVPIFLVAVLSVGLAALTYVQSETKKNLIGCVAEIVGNMLPKNYFIEQCSSVGCSYSCGLTRNCIAYRNGSVDWDQWRLDKGIFLEEGNKACFEKAVCERAYCKAGNATIGLGCSMCTSRRRISSMNC